MLQNRNYSRKKFQSAGNINNEKKFIQDWFNHPETKKRLESNLKTFPHNKFSNAGDFIKDINNNLNTVKTVYSENPKDTMDGLIKYYSEKNPTFNKETIEQLAINDFKERGGSYDEEAHTVLVNVPIKHNQAIAPHEYTHSTNTDKYFVNHLKNSTKFDEVNSNFEKLYGTGINYDTNKGLYSLKSKTTEPTLQKNIDELTRGFGNDIGTNFSVTAKLGKMGVDTKELGYINKSVEVYPRLMSIRRVGNLVPGQIVNKEMLAEIKAKMPQEKLFNYYSDEQIIEMLNTFADNNKVSYNNYAKYGGKFKRFQTAGEAGSLLTLTTPEKIPEYNKKQIEKPDLYNTPTKQDNTNYNNYKPTNQTKVTQTPITFAGKQPVYVNNKGMNAGATIKPAEPKTAYNTYFNNPSVRSTGVIPTLATGIEVVGAMEGLGLAKQGLKKLGQYAEKKMLNYGRKSFTPDLTDVGKNLYNKGATPVSIKQALSEMDKAEARKMYERMYQRMLFDQRFATLPETTNKESLGVLNDFKKRVQTPEGKKRLKNLGIADDKSLQEMSILEDPNTFGYYTDAHNKIVMNPSSPLPRKVTRHEIEHGVQNAMRIKAYEDKINTLPSIKRIFTDFQDQKINRKLRTSNTKIDDLLTKLELRREGTPTIKWDTSLPSSNKPVNIDNYFNLIANKQNATDYFLTGSEGREKSAFLAEVQQYMMDKGVIPKTSYTNITPEMVEETMANALFDEESGKHLRLFNIMKASPNNYKLVADGLNKMLSTSPYIIPSAIGLSQQNNDNQIKYKQYKSKQ